MKIFVAGPFSTKDKDLELKRVRTISKYCADLFSQGITPVSALLTGLKIAEYNNLPTDTKTWTKFSEDMVEGCDELHVLMIDGYDVSSGVLIEIEKAKLLNIPVIYIPYKLCN